MVLAAMHHHSSVSLAALAAAGLRLRPIEAVTLVRTLALEVEQGALPGVPSAHVIRLSTAGAITVEGPVGASGRPVVRAAQLLSSLLGSPSRLSAQLPPLHQIVGEALDEDSSRFVTLRSFIDALAPFAADDAIVVVRELTSRWAEAVRAAGPDGSSARVDVVRNTAEDTAPATVSDVRRARRDTGLSLREVASRSRIPIALLRQLEWGYMRNWPAGRYGRAELIRYARAARLDEQFVLDAIGSLIPVEAQRGVPFPRAARSAMALASDGPAIEIIEPTFAADEVLFEPEQEGRRVAARSGTAARAAVLTPAGTIPVSATDVHAVPARDRRGTAGRPVIDLSGTSEPPRRSSMAAAALLALVAAGAIWNMRSDQSLERPPAAHQVRHVPVWERSGSEGQQSAPQASAVPALRTTRRRAETPAPPPRAGSAAPRPVDAVAATAGVRRPGEARLVAVDATDDETNMYSAAFASAGGASFASATPVAASAEDPAGLGLRITRVLDNGSRNYNARPSPDGTKVAFDSDRDGERAVFLADADGRHLRRISGDGFAALPNWSPDGRMLAYARAEANNPAVWNLWLFDLASGDTRRLTSNAAGRPWGGSWFPDGQRLAYARGSSIVVLDAASGRSTEYPSPVSGRAPRVPSVSPNGRWIIFQVAGDGGWALDLTEGSTRRILSDPTAEQFTWSPDGTRVAYYSRKEAAWSVWVMAAR